MRLFFPTIAALMLATSVQAGVVRIEARLSDDAKSLELRYHAPRGVRELPLLGQREAVQAWWARQAQAADDCTILKPGMLQLRQGCTEARVRVALATLGAQAHYEPAQPLGDSASDGGVVSYVGYWLTAVAGHGLRVTLIPPPRGQVLWQGRWTDRAVHWALKPDEVTAALAPDDQGDTARPSLGHRQTIYLGRAPSRALPGGGRLVFDARLPAAVVDTVEATLKDTVDVLTDAFGEGPGGPVGVMMVQISGDRFIGNVSGGRSMTLNIIGSGADRPGVRGQIQRFVRHEATHWWDAGVRQSDPQASWLGEGNAEWWALRLGVAQGASLDGARSELETALNSCLQMTTSLPPKLRDWQGYPSARYPCGMSLMALAQGSRRPQGMGLRELAGLYPKNSVLTPDGVATWAGGDFARVLDATLFTTALAAAYRDKGWAQDEPLEDTATGSPRRASWMAASFWLGELMRADCNNISVSPAPDRVEIVAVDGQQCRSWPTRGEVVSIEGVAAIARPKTAQTALASACAPGAAGRYRLGLADGTEVLVDCPSRLPSPPSRLRLVPERVAFLFTPPSALTSHPSSAAP